MALSRRTGQRFQASIWPGFVDAMTGLLLVLMFVLTIFMVVQFVLRETISGQESELDALSAEVAALAQALGLEQRRSSDLQTRVGELNATIETAQDEATRQAALIASLSAERSAQDAALAQAQTRIASFEEKVAGLLAAQRADRGTIADLETRQSELMSEQEALNLALAQARDEIDAGTEAARLAAAKREALEALVAGLEAEKTGLESRLSDEEAGRLAEAAAAEALREKLKNADAELTAMTLALEQQRREAEETLTLLAAAQAAGEDLELRLAAALLADQETRTALATANTASQTLEARIATLESALEDTKAQAAGLETQLAAQTRSWEERLAASEAALAKALADADDKSGEVASLSAQLATLEAALAENRSHAEGLAAQLEAERAGLEARLAVAEAALSAAHDEAASERKSFEERLAAAQAALAAAKDEGQNLATVRDDLKDRLAAAEAALAEMRRQTESATNAAASEKSALEARLAQALADAEAGKTAGIDRDALREQLRAALAAKLAAEQQAETAMTEAQAREALLSTARDELAKEAEISTEAQRQQELLNQQVAALRSQLGSLQALLDDYKDRDAAAQVQLQSLGSDLNTALARAAAEERKRRLLEEAEAVRLAEEKARLEAEKQDLEKYKSEFFGRLRDVLGNREGVRVVGDRFVFSSEVLFPPGGAEMSAEGAAQIARVAALLTDVAAEIPEEIDWVIQVDGHTDNVPLSGFGEFADNWELSQARALSVVRYMSEELDIAPERLSANGFGEFQPVAQGNSEEARTQNRRIELKLTER
ncbi:peptidoglycan -binding protein [Alisedimentitalea sp. MJ-SS2]|uniref:peptidoglycan -binding protein n=1 Tax=Aliisedimentitalea sp. MJ-SS2 TaxID=3049795 RepID=UPI00290D40BD|nr:peptidoglycan -binding protein [Alisedimentitalea sp. MJ-SS2]MDU8926075.1 peptidoglycan -binding protein [Alisedimentitalea sp. MJ-SS2]